MTDAPRKPVQQTHVTRDGVIVRRWSPNAAAMVPVAEYRQMVDQRDKCRREVINAHHERDEAKRMLMAISALADRWHDKLRDTDGDERVEELIEDLRTELLGQQ